MKLRTMLLTVALALSFVCAMPVIAADPTADIVACAQADVAPMPAMLATDQAAAQYAIRIEPATLEFDSDTQPAPGVLATESMRTVATAYRVDADSGAS